MRSVLALDAMRDDTDTLVEGTPQFVAMVGLSEEKANRTLWCKQRRTRRTSGRAEVANFKKSSGGRAFASKSNGGEASVSEIGFFYV